VLLGGVNASLWFYSCTLDQDRAHVLTFSGGPCVVNPSMPPSGCHPTLVCAFANDEQREPSGLLTDLAIVDKGGAQQPHVAAEQVDQHDGYRPGVQHAPARCYAQPRVSHRCTFVTSYRLTPPYTGTAHTLLPALAAGTRPLAARPR